MDSEPRNLGAKVMWTQQLDELQNPRPDEVLEEDGLVAFLKHKLDGADQPMRVQQFTGGMANLTYLLSFGDTHQYVLRRPADRSLCADGS